jgi:translation elongation factor EF-1alpha
MPTKAHWFKKKTLSDAIFPFRAPHDTPQSLEKSPLHGTILQMIRACQATSTPIPIRRTK